MDLFGLTSDRVIARIYQSGARSSIPSLGRSLLIGSFGFCCASLCVFATVAFAERWMYRNLGLSGAYKEGYEIQTTRLSDNGGSGALPRASGKRIHADSTIAIGFTNDRGSDRHDETSNHVRRSCIEIHSARGPVADPR